MFVSDDESVVRYVPPRLVNEDGSIDGAAFLPRPTDADGSSVHRLDFYDANHSQSLLVIKSKFRLNRAATGKFASIVVAKLKESGELLNQPLLIDVITDALPALDEFPEDPAHALIRGLPTRGIMDELIALLISKRVEAVYPAR